MVVLGMVALGMVVLGLVVLGLVQVPTKSAVRTFEVFYTIYYYF
jgi:hypothetical protein